jgi:CBS domain containing-hemolysin-like protein
MKRSSKKGSIRFALIVSALTVPLGILFDTSTIFLNRSSWFVGVLIVVIIVLFGVVFDMLGIAAAAARETPFHAMASKRVFGAKNAIRIVRNAEKVSSVCSDVIGDIAGVLSGAGALAVSVQLINAISVNGWHREAVSILLTAFITAFTVGTKAVGKTFAIQSPTPIVLAAARIWSSISIFKRKRHIHQRRKLK